MTLSQDKKVHGSSLLLIIINAFGADFGTTEKYHM